MFLSKPNVHVIYACSKSDECLYSNVEGNITLKRNTRNNWKHIHVVGKLDQRISNKNINVYIWLIMIILFRRNFSYTCTPSWQIPQLIVWWNTFSSRYSTVLHLHSRLDSNYIHQIILRMSQTAFYIFVVVNNREKDSSQNSENFWDKFQNSKVCEATPADLIAIKKCLKCTKFAEVLKKFSNDGSDWLCKKKSKP